MTARDSFGVPAALDDYQIAGFASDAEEVERDESGVIRIYAREYEAGEAHGRWVRSQVVGKAIRLLAASFDDEIVKLKLRAFADEVELGE